MSNTKKNTKNITEKVITPPYATYYLIKEVKKCTLPLLNKQKIFDKWSLDVVEFMKYYENKDEYIEDILTHKNDSKYYKNNFKMVKDSSILLAGKLILLDRISQREIDTLILNIRNGLSNMCPYTSGYLDSWLYPNEYPRGLEDDFEEIYNTLIEIDENFDSIYEKSKDVYYKRLCLEDEHWRIRSWENEIIPIYKKLLEFSIKIFQLDFMDRMHQYSKILQDFARKIFDELIYLAGVFYMQIDDETDIKTKAKNRINQYFKKLESKTYWVFGNVSNCVTFTDKKIFYYYQELKGAINNMLISF